MQLFLLTPSIFYPSLQQGLLFLHRGTVPPVLHLDFKSLNVLLDKGYVAKVADFGLVRRMPGMSNDPRGTGKGFLRFG